MENESPSRYLLAVAAEVIRVGEIRNLFTLRLNVNQTMRQLSSRKYFFLAWARVEGLRWMEPERSTIDVKFSEFLLFSKQG